MNKLLWFTLNVIWNYLCTMVQFSPLHNYLISLTYLAYMLLKVSLKILVISRPTSRVMVKAAVPSLMSLKDPYLTMWICTSLATRSVTIAAATTRGWGSRAGREKPQDTLECLYTSLPCQVWCFHYKVECGYLVFKQADILEVPGYKAIKMACHDYVIYLFSIYNLVVYEVETLRITYTLYCRKI